MSSSHDALTLALAEAQRIGALGPQPIEASIEHALAYVRMIRPEDRTLIDLGSGGGLPGLVIAMHCPGLERIVLADRRAKRTDLLRRLVSRLGLGSVVSVETVDVVEFGRREVERGTFDVATARSFGSPGALAHAAAPFLGSAGRLLVSEPPESDGSRWSEGAISDVFHVEQITDGVVELVLGRTR